MRPTPRPGILDIAPYEPGRSGAKGHAAPVKLSSNESPLGASPEAVRAYEAAAGSLATYPDGSHQALREALADVHGLDVARIIVGAGSDELLHLLAQGYLGEGSEAVISQYGFLMYPIVTRAAGARPVIAPETDHRSDVDQMLAAVSERTRMVFLANPNNPTGTYLPAREVARLHAGLRPDIVLVIDNAYAEYVTANDYESAAALVRSSANVVMVRTFSKIGLAALRVGWLFGPAEIVDVLNRLRGPFNVSVPAQKAAIAAVLDRAFTNKLRDHNARWRDWLGAALRGNRFKAVPGQGNFLLVLFPRTPGLRAGDANAALLDNGLVVREMGAYGLPDGLRISIGTGEQMQKVAAVLNALEASGESDV